MKWHRHPTAEVQSRQIGAGSAVWQHTVVLKGARIGKNCNINCFCFIENDVVLGDNVTVKSGVYLWDGLTVESDVLIGPNATFTNDLTPRSKRYPTAFKRTVLRKGASIGAAATILGGLEIGRYAMIGAGAVITKSVPDHSLWYGNPARCMGYVCRCGHPLKRTLHCKACGLSYSRGSQGLRDKK